jgi:pimeloyl-ACP methyl ester carboxylesterase
VASKVEAIKTITLPTLIWWGEHDRLTLLEFAHNFKRASPAHSPSCCPA